jgi:hypothetical protein
LHTGRDFFVGRKLKFNIHATNKTIVGAWFTMITPDPSPWQDAKDKKAASDMRKAADAIATTTRDTAGTKPNDATKPPTKPVAVPGLAR